MIAKIRAANLEDYESVMRLYGDFVGDTERFLVLGNDSYREFIKDPDCRLDIAEMSGEIVGFIAFSIRRVIRYPKPILEVEEFYVESDKRRQGIGRELMNRAIEFARTKNCEYIFLASSKDRKEVHGFYKTNNFNEYAFHFRRTP